MCESKWLPLKHCHPCLADSFISVCSRSLKALCLLRINACASHLQVSREPLTAGRSLVTASATITVQTAGVLSLDIKVLGNAKLDGLLPSTQLQLQCSANDDTKKKTVSLSWTIKSDSDPRGIDDLAPAYDDGNRKVRVKPNTLLGGHVYKLTCAGVSSEGVGAAGFATVSVKVLGVPSGGSVSLQRSPVSVS